MINIEMKNEVWKQYPEIPFIEVSSFGNVRTLDRVVPCGKGTRLTKGHILKPYDNGRGYLYVTFGVNGKVIHKRVHRLVAQTFIPNPNNWPEVNHKDNNPANNCVSNLEWCTGEYNIEYREKFGKALRCPVFAINLETLEVSRFPSQMEAGRQLGINQAQVGGVIEGKYKQAGGYWFTEDDGHAIKIDKDKLHDVVTGKTSKRPLFAVNLKTLEVSRFQSQMEAGRVLEAYQGNINKVINGKLNHTCGYWFTYADNNAVEATRDKLGDVVADQVEELMNDKVQTA